MPSIEQMFRICARGVFRLASIRKPSLPQLTLGNTSVRYVTSSIPRESRGRNGPLLFAVLSSSLASGILGYTLSHKSRTRHDYLESPQYGSPRDFESGIKELREVFSSRDIVSTDPEVVKTHGFSAMNSYHPGRRDSSEM